MKVAIETAIGGIIVAICLALSTLFLDMSTVQAEVKNIKETLYSLLSRVEGRLDRIERLLLEK